MLSAFGCERRLVPFLVAVNVTASRGAFSGPGDAAADFCLENLVGAI